MKIERDTLWIRERDGEGGGDRVLSPSRTRKSRYTIIPDISSGVVN
jgi:hypothetical protein